MKRKGLNKLVVRSSIALTLAAAVKLPVQTRAADQVKVGHKMIVAVQEVLKTDKEQDENP